MSLLPSTCPWCQRDLDVGFAGPRLAFCRSCHHWWTVGGRSVGPDGVHDGRGHGRHRGQGPPAVCH